MKAIRLGCTLVLCLFGLLAAAGGRPAFASPPTIERISLDTGWFRASYSDICGFEILRRNVGEIQDILHTDANGVPTREITQFHMDSYFTANGHSLTGNFIVDYNVTNYPDGSTRLSAGRNTLFIVPGVGPIAGNAGHFEVLLDPDGNPTFLESQGPDYGLEGFCAALAP